MTADLLTTPVICAELGIERHTWRRWVRSLQAPQPVPNVPGLPRWRRHEIDAFKQGTYRRGRRHYFAKSA